MPAKFKTGDLVFVDLSHLVETNGLYKTKEAECIVIETAFTGKSNRMISVLVWYFDMGRSFDINPKFVTMDISASYPSRKKERTMTCCICGHRSFRI